MKKREGWWWGLRGWRAGKQREGNDEKDRTKKSMG